MKKKKKDVNVNGVSVSVMGGYVATRYYFIECTKLRVPSVELIREINNKEFITHIRKTKIVYL